MSVAGAADARAPSGDAIDPAARWPQRLAMVGLPLLGAVLVLLVTRDGPGLCPDSRGYLMAAEHVASGRGITILNGDGVLRPLTHYPPLYALIIAPAEWAGYSAIAWSRLYNAALFAVSICLLARLARCCGGTWWVAAFCAAAFALSPHLLHLHAMVLSEPTFLAAFLAALLLLGRYLGGDGGRRALTAAGAALGAAVMTRYSGAPFVAAVVLCVLLHGRRPRGRRVVDALLLATMACLPIAAWMLRNAYLTGNPANRPIVFHPPGRDALLLAVHTLSSWLLPQMSRAMRPLGFGAVALLASAAVLSPRIRCLSRASEPGTSTRWLIACAAVCYACFILFSVCFVDAHTPLDHRILAPLHVALIVLVPLWLARLRSPRPAAQALAAAFLMVLAVRAGLWMREAPERWLGYATRQWRQCELAHFVRALPPDALIYTNAVDYLYLGQRRFAKPVPDVVDLVSRRPDVRYGRKLRLMYDDLRDRHGYVVYFTTVKRRGTATESRLKGDMPLVAVHRAREGSVYQLDVRPRPRRAVRDVSVRGAT